MLLYIRARASGEALVLAGVTVPTEGTLPVYTLWGFIPLTFATITITASYGADVMIFRVAQSYMENAVGRVLRHHAAGRPLDLPEDIETRSSKPIALMLQGDTYRLVRVVVQTLGVLLPLITLAASAVALVVTNWMLALLLMPVVALYSYGLGLLNREVMRDSQKRQHARRYLTRDVAAILRTLDQTRYPAGGEPSWLSSYPRQSWLMDVMAAFRGILMTKKRVAYLSDAFQGVALLMVVMVFGTLVADRSTSWAVLLTYLLALGYATRSMGGHRSASRPPTDSCPRSGATCSSCRRTRSLSRRSATPGVRACSASRP